LHHCHKSLCCFSCHLCPVDIVCYVKYIQFSLCATLDEKLQAISVQVSELSRHVLAPER